MVKVRDDSCAAMRETATVLWQNFPGFQQKLSIVADTD